MPYISFITGFIFYALAVKQMDKFLIPLFYCLSVLINPEQYRCGLLPKKGIYYEQKNGVS